MANLDVVVAVRDRLPEVLGRVKAGTTLVDVGDLDRLADLDAALVRRLETHDGLEECRLADTVGADDTHDAVARQGE